MRRCSARGLDVIERSARSQVQLIGDLLDVSRIIRGQAAAGSARGRPGEGHRSGARRAFKPAAASEADRRWTGRRRRASARIDRRRAPPAAGGVEPGVQRDQVHAGAGGRVELELEQRRATTSTIARARHRPRHPGGFLPYVFDRFRQADSTSWAPARRPRPRSLDRPPSGRAARRQACAPRTSRADGALYHRGAAASHACRTRSRRSAVRARRDRRRTTEATGCGSTASASSSSRTSPMRARR